MTNYLGISLMLHRFFSFMFCLLSLFSTAWAQSTGIFELDFREQQTDELLPCRVRISSPAGKAVGIRGSANVQGWNLIEDGKLSFRGRAGEYRYEAFHGLEYSASSGGFTLDRKSSAVDVVHLPRHANLAQEGWYGGDLFSRLSSTRLSAWLPAEGLTMAVSTDSPLAVEATVDAERTNTDQPGIEATVAAALSQTWCDTDSYWDGRSGSGLTLHHWWPPAEVPPDLPSSRLLMMAVSTPPTPEQLPVHPEIQRLWARDVPIWLASGKIASIQLLSDHLTFDGQQAASVAALLDPAPELLRGPTREGRLVEQIYWRVLEAGLRIPPTAGSGFGHTSSPLGYNRVYVQIPEQRRDQWWQAVAKGRSFVTNGPLLRVAINGHAPGHVFTSQQEPVSIDVALQLTVADPVEYLEVVFNGETIYRARLDEFAKQGGRIPSLQIDQSGWLLVRVVTARDHTYRFATTAPYYFEFGSALRISPAAVAFFAEWLELSAKEIEQLDEPARTAALPYVAAARKYWQQRATLAN